jgi:hypothetical protein
LRHGLTAERGHRRQNKRHQQASDDHSLLSSEQAFVSGWALRGRGPGSQPAGILRLPNPVNNMMIPALTRRNAT